jgi:hypothetical protein
MPQTYNVCQHIPLPGVVYSSPLKGWENLRKAKTRVQIPVGALLFTFIKKFKKSVIYKIFLFEFISFEKESFLFRAAFLLGYANKVSNRKEKVKGQ